MIWAILVIMVFAFFGDAFELKPSNTPWHWWVIGGGITIFVLSVAVFKPGQKDARFKSGYKDNEDPNSSEHNNASAIGVILGIVATVFGAIVEYFFY